MLICKVVYGVVLFFTSPELGQFGNKVVRFSVLICFFHLLRNPNSRSKQSRGNQVAAGRCSQSHTLLQPL